MLLQFLLHGIFVGIIISFPVGPVNVICLSQTLQHGRVYGFKSTIGATIADTIFAIIASLGVKIFITFITDHQTAFEIGSGLVILSFGIFLFYNNLKNDLTTGENVYQHFGNYFKSFLFTISNPLTVLFFIAYLTNLGTHDSEFNAGIASIFVTGVVFGSLTWFYSLSGIVARVKEKINLKYFRHINVICGCILCIAGFVLLVKSLTT
ncbi:MAG: LysE family translocator [Mangrovibacterium sp.]